MIRNNRNCNNIVRIITALIAIMSASRVEKPSCPTLLFEKGIDGEFHVIPSEDKNMSLINQIQDIHGDFDNEKKLFQNESIDSGCLSDASDSSLDLPSKSIQQDGQDSDREEKELNTVINKIMTDSGFLSHNGNEDKEVNDDQNQSEAKALNNIDDPSAKQESPKFWKDLYQQNDDGNTWLHLACISEDENLVKTILLMAPHSCLYDILNDDCQAALHLAALTKQPKMLRMLLLAGADPFVRDHRGNTALHLACRSGIEECVDSLITPFREDEIEEASRQYSHRNCSIRLTQDLELSNYNGESCVHLAANLGFQDILRRLVSHGADINAKEKKCGHTPLHIAIVRGNEILAQFLLNECKEIDVERITFGGLTAYQLASKNKKLELQNLLGKHGAKTLPIPQSTDYNSDTDSDTESDDSAYNVTDPSGSQIFEDDLTKIADGITLCNILIDFCSNSKLYVTVSG
uniref:ANK_REP_REGION domain-containing protein n=1 Tax=Glossina brevipalpis TaxID=37001 RepID=A0A1A9W9G3_9MUSC